MTQFYNEYSKVLVSVDCIIFGFNGSSLQVLIGKRKMDPGRGEWSLYGGFVGAEENLEDAANRVIYELTGMQSLYIRQVGAFGRIDRDPGERVISIAYCALINVVDYDDSLRIEHGLEWVSLNELPELYSDHRTMIHDAICQIRRRINHEPLSFKLLPNLFTLTQLQHVFEAVMGEEIDKRNFRKRVKEIDFIEKTELIDKVNSKRGAALYRFNKKAYEEDRDYYLERRYPAFGNLVPRDVASRAAKERCDKGFGVNNTGLAVFLDFSESINRLGIDVILQRYGNLFDMYEEITDVNPGELANEINGVKYYNPMMIFPAIHYTMGGIWVDYELMTTIPGLFAIGECNFSDHGANRLGASALMQGLADGYFVLPYTIQNYLADQALWPKLSTDLPEFAEAEAGVQKEIDRSPHIRRAVVFDHEGQGN